MTYASGVESPARTAFSPATRVDRLTKRFGRVVAVEDLSSTVAPSEVFGLGPNGAGKSTTVRLLLGLIRPTAGSAKDIRCDAGDVRRFHHHIAYVPADAAFWPRLRGAEILDLLGNVGPGVDAAYRDELVDSDFGRPFPYIC